MPFVLNDDNHVNTYGFSVLTAGIRLDGFRNNPVMLESHRNEVDYTIGRWDNLAVTESTLEADPVFDVEEPRAIKVKSKVERGFLKGASMGITFDSDQLQNINGQLVLVSCELLESSIVPVPSNSGAIRLFSPDGKPLEDNVVREMCMSVREKKETKPDTKMKKFQISLAALTALGFKEPEDSIDEGQLNAKIEALGVANGQLAAQLQALSDEKAAAHAQKIAAMVNLAVTEGRITADKKETFVKLAEADYALVESTLAALPKKQSIAGTEQPVAGGDSMTMEKFQKLSIAEQLAFKTGQPELYKKLINSKK